MKKLLFVIGILVFANIGCGSSDNSDQFPPEVTNPTLNPFKKVASDEKMGVLFTYRFVEENGCDTKTRAAFSLDQLCKNLQLSDANAACAEESRKNYFQAHCEGRTWNEEVDLQKTDFVAGGSIRCFLSEPTFGGRKVAFRQDTSDEKMMMVGTYHYAVINRSVSNGSLKVSAEIFDKEGASAGKGEKIWTDSKTEALQMSAVADTAFVKCLPLQ